jgi:biotin synthase
MKEIFLCAINNILSGTCNEDCKFCTQSVRYHADIERYTYKTIDQIVNEAKIAKANGALGYCLVTAGKGLDEKKTAFVADAAAQIKEEVKDLNLIACNGTATRDQLLYLKEHGVDSYNHNLETSRSFFKHICTTHDYDRAVATVKTAKAAGLYVCSGGIMGLGESWAQRVELALTLRELEVDSIPLNFLVPVSGTPLADESGLTPYQALLTIAMFRFVCPTVDIRICGGRQRTFGDFQSLVLAAGANGLMVGNYLTTSGRQWSDDQRMLADWRAFESEAAGE